MDRDYVRVPCFEVMTINIELILDSGASASEVAAVPRITKPPATSRRQFCLSST